MGLQARPISPHGRAWRPVLQLSRRTAQKGHPTILPTHFGPMLSGITITCFAASYFVTLLVELSRLFFRARIRTIVNIGFAAAGIFAHTLYLYARAQAAMSEHITPLSNWYDWCLIAAWIVAAAYFGLVVRRTDNAVGVFLLPLVLAIIGVAVYFQKQQPFPHAEAMSAWRMIHGIALLLGTVTMTLGFAAGLMYLFQSYRLKHKYSQQSGLKLPSLEWLQRFNTRALLTSTALLAAGLLSGIVLNAGSKQGTVSWTDPVVLSSGVLFAWLVAASLFEFLYKPARQGRKVAYLTMASFVFLAMALGFVLFGQHASKKEKSVEATTMKGARGTATSDESVGVSPRTLPPGGVT